MLNGTVTLIILALQIIATNDPIDTPEQLTIPSIYLTEKVIPGDQTVAPAKNVGYTVQFGTIFMYGHDYGVFKNLVNVKKGQLITLQGKDYKWRQYVVKRTEVVRNTNTYQQVSDEAKRNSEEIVIFTCYNQSKERYLLFLDQKQTI